MNDATKVSIKNETNNIMNLCNLLSWNALLQNNKINGGIMHVFKDNPKKGYGIFIDEIIKL